MPSENESGLMVQGVSVRYGSLVVLENTNAVFPDSGVHLIVGKNGSGKTTLFNAINELIPVESGSMCIREGNQEFRWGSEEFRTRVYYLPSDFYLPQYMTGDEYAQFVLSGYPSSKREAISPVADALGMADAMRNLIETYSFGMKKKLQFIALLASGATYAIADEPFSGLDIETALLMEEVIARMQKTRSFIVVTHDVSMIDRFPTDIHVMEKGRLTDFDGASHELLELLRKEGGTNVDAERIITSLGADEVLS